MIEFMFTMNRLKIGMKMNYRQIWSNLEIPKVTCNICFDECQEENAIKNSCCGNSFCVGCLKSWCNTFRAKTCAPSCPMCRELIKKENLKKVGCKVSENWLPKNWKKRFDYRAGPTLGQAYYVYETDMIIASYWLSDDDKPTEENENRLIAQYGRPKENVTQER